MNVIDDAIIRLNRLATLKDQISRCREEAARLPELEREYKAMHDGLTKSLDSIDVAARGNFGWERRIVPFLMEFKNAVEASATLSESKGE